MSLTERTVPGLHSFVVDRVLKVVAPPPATVVDLGCGTGALIERLLAAGYAATGVDADAAAYRGTAPAATADLDDSAAVRTALADRRFEVVTAIEVIEHLRSPIDFLALVDSLLLPGGVAVLSTPNLESASARVKFLLKGRLRLFDEWGDPTHISPIFLHLIQDRYLPKTGLLLAERMPFPSSGHAVGRRSYNWVLRALEPALRHKPVLLGDCHVLVLRKAD